MRLWTESPGSDNCIHRVDGSQGLKFSWANSLIINGILSRASSSGAMGALGSSALLCAADKSGAIMEGLQGDRRERPSLRENPVPW